MGSLAARKPRVKENRRVDSRTFFGHTFVGGTYRSIHQALRLFARELDVVTCGEFT